MSSRALSPLRNGWNFGKRGKQGQHLRRSWPEKKAQSLLHTFLKGHFRQRVGVFEELSSGAGRIDIYLQFYGGLSLILELKMCGRRYSEKYAAGGEDQLEHYMRNRDLHLGYLIVFDARTANFGAPLLSGQSQFKIFEKNIDVRPNVKTAPHQGQPGKMPKAAGLELIKASRCGLPTSDQNHRSGLLATPPFSAGVSQ